MLPTCESSTYMAFTERNAALHKVNQQVNNMRDRRQHSKEEERQAFLCIQTYLSFHTKLNFNVQQNVAKRFATITTYQKT